ncbi:hypothetical protein GUJ93_ZPchr0011g28456 [Zizania palustris]|uniref:Uncharacterized protein n=1 Tax=Zizania palustris TaxID=103762 RepID=A0A8J5WGV5_ZIZPA|nr:hypothetical protein GUJ93_ZPchr0011g28456 [Zizania palustris]
MARGGGGGGAPGVVALRGEVTVGREGRGGSGRKRTSGGYAQIALSRPNGTWQRWARVELLGAKGFPQNPVPKFVLVYINKFLPYVHPLR